MARLERRGRWPCHVCRRWITNEEGSYQIGHDPKVQVFACHHHAQDGAAR